jgi:hypothetical protein
MSTRVSQSFLSSGHDRGTDIPTLRTGFAELSKRSGRNVDANTQEKITDTARGFYEKATGYVLPFFIPQRHTLPFSRLM